MSDQQEEQYNPASTEGVPEHGRERLQKMKAANFFTSDLSVNEFLLVKEAGFDPLGLVIVSSIYHVGYQRGQWNQNQEMDVLSRLALMGNVRSSRDFLFVLCQPSAAVPIHVAKVHRGRGRWIGWWCGGPHRL